MNSVRNHRVIIASLFLPNTAALGDTSAAPTPILTAQFSAPPPALHLVDKINSPIEKLQGTVLPKSPVRPRMPGRFESIVDDLKDKSKAATPALTPTVEAANPFSSLSSITSSAQSFISSVVPSLARSPSLGSHRHPLPHRVARKNSSRSSSRQPDRERDRELAAARLYHIEANPHCNGGLKNAINSVEDKLRRKLWVGALGTTTDGFSDDLRKSIDKRMLEECDSLPVWIPDSEFSKCYDEFCHQVLWPCLHYAIPDAPKTKSFYESASYSQYVAVNQHFADAIVANYVEGDIIWVNDYHLMLLPRLLRLRLPHAPIGFFLHVAFPSSEIFRCLSVRQQLLRGLLAADLIGFQTANFARHFRQTVSRILSLEALPKGIQVEDRFVDVAVFPMGIDVAALDVKKREPEVAEWVNLLKQRYTGMKMIVGRDKMDEVQGVRHKIQAFEQFLEKYPEFHEKVVLIQVALSTTEENELQGRVADVVSRINSRFSTLTYQPVVFLHTQDLTFSQYLALLTVADAFLVTSLREGMALRTHEYVECQEGRARPLILSEFTGSYSYSGFRSCIAVNPWDAKNTAKAIHQALTMSDEEALSRWQDLHNHVVTQTAQAFVTSFLTRCLRANMEHMRRELDVQAAPKLDIPRVLPRYRHSRKRLILIDFEGTLWARDPRIRTFDPPTEALDLLNKLASDRRNEVWLLSGLPVKGALEEVAKVVPHIGIVAENGCFLKPRTVNGKQSDWISFVSNFNLTWKSSCVEILTYFTERTPGSFVEEREASVVWRFWTGENDDPAGRQWARRQAAEAQNHIFDSLGERYGLRIIPGVSSFLVLPNNISRSTAVGIILSPNAPIHSPISPRSAAFFTSDSGDTADTTDNDFVLAVGRDEKLLRRLNELDIAETCSTSNEGTDARWKLDPSETPNALWKFANVA